MRLHDQVSVAATYWWDRWLDGLRSGYPRGSGRRRPDRAFHLGRVFEITYLVENDTANTASLLCAGIAAASSVGGF